MIYFGKEDAKMKAAVADGEAGLGMLVQVAESGEPEPRGAACAKKRASGRVQRPAERVPIPWCGVKAPESSGKLLHFGKIGF